MLTTQRMFDCAVTHLFLQDGERSVMGTSDRCRYRSENAKKQLTRCVIGLFIPDSIYNEEMEGHPPAPVIGDTNIEYEASEVFLCDLQTAHDQYGNLGRKEVVKYLAEIAHRYNLNTKLLNLLFCGSKPDIKLDNQTILDAATIWLWVQDGVKCEDDGVCLYRKQDNNFVLTRCIAELFLVDLNMLQHIYDTILPQDVGGSLRNLAERNNLQPDIVNILFEGEVK